MAIIVGFTGDDPLLRGTVDADDIYGDTTGTLSGLGGNDRIFGLAGDDVLSGDGFFVGPGGRGGDDVIQGGDGEDKIYGDARDVVFGIGGNDVIYQNGGSGRMYGDGEDIAAGGRGGNDRLYGGFFMIGDGDNAFVSAQGGNDLLDATSSTQQTNLHGETNSDMAGTSIGGNDTIKGSAFGDIMSGEANGTMSGASRGGDDRLEGNGGTDVLVGDGFQMEGTAVGGDDVLRGGADDDDLYGDARSLNEFTVGGDDRLNGGAGDDEIWGDGDLNDDAIGGKDRFIFSGNFGDDEIFDFRPEDGDRIVLQGLTQSEVQISIVTVTAPNDSTLITTLGDQSVTLVGFTGSLTVGADIVFA
jgi:Ca2+-binding RTX toxin-like protein